jgi:hypothetical protein
MASVNGWLTGVDEEDALNATLPRLVPKSTSTSGHACGESEIILPNPLRLDLKKLVRANRSIEVCVWDSENLALLPGYIEPSSPGHAILAFSDVGQLNLLSTVWWLGTSVAASRMLSTLTLRVLTLSTNPAGTLQQ